MKITNHNHPPKHTRQLCSRDLLQCDHRATWSKHEAIATRARVAHEQPPKGVATQSQPVVPRTDRKRCWMMVPNSVDVWWSNLSEQDREWHLRWDHPLQKKLQLNPTKSDEKRKPEHEKPVNLKRIPTPTKLKNWCKNPGLYPHFLLASTRHQFLLNGNWTVS